MPLYVCATNGSTSRHRFSSAKACTAIATKASTLALALNTASSAHNENKNKNIIIIVIYLTKYSTRQCCLANRLITDIL